MKNYRNNELKYNRLLTYIFFILILFAIGYYTQKLLPKIGFDFFKFPLNIILSLSHISIISFLFLKFKKTKIFLWLSETLLSILIISIFSTIVIIKYVNVNSVYFKFFKPDLVLIVLFFYLSTILLISIFQKFSIYKLKTIAQTTIHIGVYVLLIYFWFSVTDSETFYFNLFKSTNKTNLVIDSNHEIKTTPFYLQLIDFKEFKNTSQYKNKFDPFVISKNLTQNTLYSKIVIEKDLIFDTIEIKTNKYVKFSNWQFIQYGYDETKGNESQLSIVQIQYNPWYNLLWVSIFLIVTGMLLHLINEGLRKIWIH